MKGYAGKILICDLTTPRTTTVATEGYAARFLGGRGMAARLYWELAPPQGDALDVSNPLVVATGPLAGFTGLAGSHWQMCARSPSTTPQGFNHASFGGSWGAHLKFAGFDGLVIRGAAAKPSYLFIQDGICNLRDASHLWGKGTVQVREMLKRELGRDVRVLATGPAGENRVSLASLLADEDASGSRGFGAVMASKKLKAIAVAGSNRPQPADPAKLRHLTGVLRQLQKRNPDVPPTPPPGMEIQQRACFGCIAGCLRSTLKATSGQSGKYLCTSGGFYETWARRHYGERNEVPFLATCLCDDYGLDASSIEAMLVWLYRCHRAGIVTEENSGLPLGELGSLEFIQTLLRKITFREGFGDTLAQGTITASRELGSEAEKLLGTYVLPDGTGIGSGPRLYPTNALIHALEPRQHFPQTGDVGLAVTQWLEWIKGNQNAEVNRDLLKLIARRFWGSTAAADLSTYNGKALAAKMIQDRHYVKESAMLCYFSWRVSGIELARPGIISEILTAVTGVPYEEDDVYRLGERIFNLQRAVIVRERGYGREGDVLMKSFHDSPLRGSAMNTEMLVPGPGGRPISRKGAVVDRQEFERLKDEYYELRGWDVTTGLPTEARLSALGLDDIIPPLKEKQLVI